MVNTKIKWRLYERNRILLITGQEEKPEKQSLHQQSSGSSCYGPETTKVRTINMNENKF